MNNPFYKFKWRLILLIFLSIISIIKVNSNNRETSNEQLNNINKKLEKIEDHIYLQNNDLLCQDSLESIRLINDNIIKLNKVEPYYDWHEIKGVLEKLTEEGCH